MGERGSRHRAGGCVGVGVARSLDRDPSISNGPNKLYDNWFPLCRAAAAHTRNDTKRRAAIFWSKEHGHARRRCFIAARTRTSRIADRTCRLTMHGARRPGSHGWSNAIDAPAWRWWDRAETAQAQERYAASGPTGRLTGTCSASACIPQLVHLVELQHHSIYLR